jgi:hypothetical protein
MKNLILFTTILLFANYPVQAQNSISGYVVCLEEAKPIANATIFLKNQYGLTLEDSLTVLSDSTGFYQIERIKNGSYVLNAKNIYRSMDQQYAIVIQSDVIEVDGSLEIDLVFSRNDFKQRLFFYKNPEEAFVKPKERIDLVTRRAVQPQLYINSDRETLGASYFEKTSN